MNQNINLEEEEHLPTPWVPRVVRGGKDGDPPDLTNKNWLKPLPIGTVFVTSAKGSIQAFLFELVFKGELFSLLHQEVNGITNDIYVNNHLWCIEHKDYEVLGINPPDRGGTKNEPEQRDPC
jgi:hypothetical protein